MSQAEGLVWLLQRIGLKNCSISSVKKDKVAPVSHSAKDWADLGELEFQRAIQSLTLLELDGAANRRRHLRNLDLKQWSESQRSAILSRKYELERDQ